jgi:hypothetical protein
LKEHTANGRHTCVDVGSDLDAEVEEVSWVEAARPPDALCHHFSLVLRACREILIY